MQFGDNGQYGNGCTSVCGLQVQWMYTLQDQITGAREIKGNPVRASHTLLFIILLVFSLCASGWGACTSGNYFVPGLGDGYNAWCYIGGDCNTGVRLCSDAGVCGSGCPSSYTRYDGVLTGNVPKPGLDCYAYVRLR